MVSVGELVLSLCGHDKGDYFIVTEVADGFVTICDGKRRKFAKNKKKKIKHIRPMSLYTEIINNVPPYAVDANIRREIKRLIELI